VGVTVEAVDEAFEIEISGQGSKIAVVKCSLELTPGVKTTALVPPEHVKHLLNAR
jgi:hypothetical protein